MAISDELHFILSCQYSLSLLLYSFAAYFDSVLKGGKNRSFSKVNPSNTIIGTKVRKRLLFENYNLVEQCNKGSSKMFKQKQYATCQCLAVVCFNSFLT